MKNYYDEQYEGFYEKAYEAMEMGEKLESILYALEGIGDVLAKLLAVTEAKLAPVDEAEETLAPPAFKIGADLEEKVAQVESIAKIFGNA